jgi:hypothetical protein
MAIFAAPSLTTGAKGEHNPVASTNPGKILSYGLNNSCNFMVKHRRKLHGKESVPGSNVRMTNSTGNDADSHLIRAGLIDFNIFKGKRATGFVHDCSTGANCHRLTPLVE